MSIEQIDKIIDKYVNEKGVLIQLLLDIQRQLNWIPKEAVMRIHERLKIPVSEIYRVASFYTALSLKPRGRHLVRVCAGTACYVRGGPKTLDSVERTLKIKSGETTSDKLSLWKPKGDSQVFLRFTVLAEFGRLQLHRVFSSIA